MTRVQNKKITVNSNVYYDPHKWIVCLIGSDSYPVKNFLNSHIDKLNQVPNLSVSLMALSSEPLTRGKEYRELCHSTSEGVYVNIVDTCKAGKVAEKFFSTMDVYPS